MPKIILHLDMNSYFASCEQQANPHLRHVPVGICEHLGGIIIAPSVEAKRIGIKLGTTVWDARKIYPKIVLLPVDPDKIRSITERFLGILHDYTDRVEKYSIDEAFVDITEISTPSPLIPLPHGERETDKRWDNALMLGLEIKQRIRQEIGEWVSCSIGIGSNKLVAKIAADLPRSKSVLPSGSTAAVAGRLISNGGKGERFFLDNISVIKPGDISSLYDRLELTDMPGIGARLERALHKLHIFSLRQLRDYPVANLINQFGINGYFLHELARFNFSITSLPLDSARGTLPSPGESNKEEIKSIGHSYTLPKPISKITDIKKLMFKLAEKIGRRMRRKAARGNVIHYFHSDKRYDSFARQHKIEDLVDDGRDIYQAAFRIFLQAISPYTKSFGAGVKIMGISVSGLKFDSSPEPLFEQYKRPAWLVAAMDQINNKYGEFTISRGRLINIPEEWGKDTVGFGRMKEF